MRDPAGEVLWTTATYAPWGFLRIQDDGNLVLYSAGRQPLWDSMGYTRHPAVSYVPRVNVTRLDPGTSVTTPLGGYRLDMAGSGSATVTDVHNVQVWTSGSTTADSYLVMQPDGNLVVYSSAGTPLWDSAGVLGRTGIWFVPKRIVTGLASGSSAVSNDGRHVLTMDSGGDLTVTTGGTLRWHAGSGTPGSVLRAQPDGNAVVYRPDGSAAWHSVVYSPGAVLVLQDDGNVVVYSPSGRALWDAMGFTGNRGRLLGP